MSNYQPAFSQSRAGSNSSAQSYSIEDYNVGWICALSIELAAASAMLDTKHSALPKSYGDTNSYTLGSIGVHRVVLAALPSGHYGTNNAATVANNMRRTFPNISVRLMVGIGGGVPDLYDVRLGDVVVGEKVIQHDFGKITGEGGIQHTSSMVEPPLEILTAIANLRAIHETQKSTMSDLLDEMIKNNPTMTEYTRSTRLQDRLYLPSYQHASPSSTCAGCHPSMLVDRVERKDDNPHIHYGVVASGNQVLKFGQARRTLAQKLDAKCVEMEAAGLMHSFPCLVIRGICDYCDSHKNKDWQRYAAAVAAAYAKELLLFIPPSTSKTDSNISQLAFTATSSKSRFNHLSCSYLTSLQAPEYSVLDRQRGLWKLLEFKQLDARRSSIKAKHSDTCDWLLKHEDYISWLDRRRLNEHQGFLWIRGNPGVGKSTLMNFAFEQSVNDRNIVTISFFFNARGSHLERSLQGMYRSLLYQLLDSYPVLLSVFDSHLYRLQLNRILDSMKNSNSKEGDIDWPLRLLQDLLRTAIGQMHDQPLVLFVDALDECKDDEVQDMIEYFEELGMSANSAGNWVRTCFSSRHFPHVSIEHGRALTLERQLGHEHDIMTYINDKLRIGSGTLAATIKPRVASKANGIFMWVVLVVKILNDEYKMGRIPAVKRRLDEIPAELGDLFKDIIRNSKDHLDEFRLCVQWILFANGRLKVEELYFAIIAGVRPHEINELTLEISTEDMERFVLNSSRGLAETSSSKFMRTGGGSSVQWVVFIHESVREYFLREGIQELWHDRNQLNFEELSHGELSRCCRAYCKHLSGLMVYKNIRRPFLHYALEGWLWHLNKAPESEQAESLKHFSAASWFEMWNRIHPGPRTTQWQYVLYRLDVAAKPLLDDWVFRSTDTELFTKVIMDILQGLVRVSWGFLGLLLTHPRVDFHIKDIKAHTDGLLKGSIYERREDIVQTLLAQNLVEKNTKGADGHTALTIAVKEGQANIVRMLEAAGWTMDEAFSPPSQSKRSLPEI